MKKSHLSAAEMCVMLLLHSFCVLTKCVTVCKALLLSAYWSVETSGEG